MEIIVGKNAGFCGGVTNSVVKTERLLDKENELYCLGELVHNKHVVDKLKSKGLVVIDNLDDVSNCKVVVRAHGITKELYELASKKNIELVDLTCPKVLLIHKLAESLKDGYIVLVGQKSHPECIGTISYCGKDSCIVESIDEVEEVSKKVKNKLYVIAQTTYSMSKFEDIVNKFKEILDDNVVVDVRNTICNATSLRQQEALEMARSVDCMIVIGGRNSSNTLKLYDIGNKYCKNAFMIEDACELDNIEGLKNYVKIGIMAGASTPRENIDEVYKYLNNL